MDSAPRFFIDRCLDGKRLTTGMIAAGFDIVTISGHYGQHAGASIADVDWLELCGRAGWVALTKDSRITRNPPELAAVASFSVKFVTISCANATIDRLLELIVSNRRALERIWANAGPSIHVITPRGMRNESCKLG